MEQFPTAAQNGAGDERAVLDDVTVCTKVKNESAYPLHESVEVYVKYKTHSRVSQASS